MTNPLTGIIVTAGPAAADPETLERLIAAGAGAFRINFSHGSPDDHGRLLDAVRKASARRDRDVAVIGDLRGPKIRVGRVAGDGVAVDDGATVVFRRGEVTADAEPPLVFSTSGAALADHAEPGHRVLVDDGAVHLLIVDKTRDDVVCTVTHGGTISSKKGVNLPDSDPDLTPVTERDVENVRWAVDRGVDFLAQSYVASARDVRRLADVVREVGGGVRLPIIAKIERPAAVDDAENIVDAADAVMVARGDLGVEMDVAQVPVIQKRLVAAAARAGKPCIVATQMLQSMIERPSPTRAEASDVAGAIFDQVDCVMLSGETAVGRFPVVAVDTMRRIALEAEAFLAAQPAQARPPARLVETGYRTAALAHGVWTVAGDLKAKVIVVWSQSGGGARYLSQNRFRIPIVAVSTDRRALRQMQILRGVRPVHMDLPRDLAHFTELADERLLASGWADRGDPCLLVAGEPLGRAGVTNRLALHWVGDPASGFASPE